MSDKLTGWAIVGLKLPKEQAVEKIEADSTIPAEDKAWILAKIAKSGFEGVIVDAHEHFHDGITVMHGSIGKLY